MAEQEELRLIVSLTDNASTGLAKLRSEMEKLGGGKGGKGLGDEFSRLGSSSMQNNIERFQRAIAGLSKGSLQPMAGLVGGLGEGFVGLARGLGTVGAAFAAVGGVAYVVNRQMSEFADTMRRWGQLQNQTGFGIAPMKQMAELMRENGLGAEQIDRTLSGLAGAMARFARENRKFRGEILSQTPINQREAMSALLGELAPLVDNPQAFANKVKEIGERIRESGVGPIRGSQAQKKWLDIFGVGDLQNVRGQFQQTSKEQEQLEQRMLENAREYDRITGKIANNWDRIKTAYGSMLVEKFKPLLDTLDRFTEAVKKLMEKDAGGKPGAGLGAGVSGALGQGAAQAIPGVGQALGAYNAWQALQGALRGYYGTTPQKQSFQGGGTEGTVRLIKLTDNVDELDHQIVDEVKATDRLTDQMIILNVAFAKMLGTTGGGGGSSGAGAAAGITRASLTTGGYSGGDGGAGAPNSVAGRDGGGRVASLPPPGGSGGTGAIPSVTPGTPGAAVDLAMTQLGLNENKDRRDIQQYLRTGGAGMDPARVAWCAAFVGSSLQQAGIKGTGSMVANSYLNWGNAATGGIQKGDVLVRPQGRGPGQTGGHVGMATGRIDPKTGKIQMISGNTSNQVGLTWENPNRIVARRAPIDRGAIDRAGGGTVNHNVTGTGNLKIKVVGPPGTEATGSVSGLFKQMEIDRNIQMAPAGTGASDSIAGGAW